MYRIYCDECPIWSPADGYFVSSPRLKLSANKAGELSFTIDPTHAHYDRLVWLAPVVTVYKRGWLIFRGRVVSTKTDFDNMVDVVAEGVLACLHDSIVRPFNWPGALYTYTDDDDDEQEGYFNWLIAQHNAQVGETQRFTVGYISPGLLASNYLVRSSPEYRDTWETIERDLLDTLGGYITLTLGQDSTTINYLTADDLPGSSSQVIEFGQNLIDLDRSIDGADMYTACIPLGAKLKDISGDDAETDDHTRLDIADVTIYDTGSDDVIKSGDMLYSSSRAAIYGTIIAPVDDTTWGDVTSGAELVTKGAAFLTNNNNLRMVIEAKAVDLSVIDGTLDDLAFLDRATLRSTPHGVSGSYLLEDMDIPLDAPDDMVVTFGGEARQLSDVTARRARDEAAESERISRLEQGTTLGAVVTGVEQTVSSQISQLSDSIVSQVLASEVVVKAQQYYAACGGDVTGALLVVASDAAAGQIDITDVSPVSSDYAPAVGDYVHIVTGSEDYAALKSLVSSIITQTAEVLDLSFLTSRIEQTIDGRTGAMMQTLTELTDFIRFGTDSNGAYMLLGRAADPLSLKVGRTRVEFLQNGATVAYMSDNKLYVTYGEFLTHLILGKFAFIPRANGNLSLRKVK